MTLDATGFTPKNLTTIQTELEASFRKEFGADLLLTPDTLHGKLVGIFAEREDSQYQLLQALYDSFSPATASGISLDRVSSITGVARNPATRSTSPVYLAGDVSTVIPIGTIIGVDNSTVRFRTTAEVTLSVTDDVSIASASPVSCTLVQAAGTATATATTHGMPNGAIVTIAGANEPEYNITAKIFNVSANNFDYTVDAGADSPATGTITFVDEGLAQEPGGTLVTVRAVAHGLIAVDLRQIVLATETDYNRVFAVVTVLDANHFTWEGTQTFSATPATGAFEGKEANLANVESVALGNIAGLAHSINDIINAISGWEGADNLNDATTGVALETDTALRTRRESALQGLGNATLEAIAADMLLVPGVTSVFVFENDTDVTSGIRTPHSIEVVLLGGSDPVIAPALFNTKGAGIATVGTSSENHTDSQGTVHVVKFSRPTIRDIWIEINVTVDADYPADGDTQVKNALTAFGVANYGIGADVIPIPQLIGAVDLIPGIRDILIGVLDVADGAGDPSPVPGTDDGSITISETNIAKFDNARITVTQV